MSSSWAGYNLSIAANRYQQMFITNYLDISGRLLVNSGDVSFNDGNLYVGKNVGIGMVANSGYELDVLGDVRNNGNLIVLGDASLNSNLFVNNDISLNGNITLGKDLTIKGRLNVQNYTNTNIINTTVNNYQLIVSEDLSLNGRLVASGNITTSETVRYNKLAPLYTSVPTFATTDIGYVIKGTALISSLTTVSATVASIAIQTDGVWFIVAQIMYFSATNPSVEIISGIYDATPTAQSSTKTTPVAMMGATLTHIHSGSAQTFTLRAHCGTGTCSVETATNVTFIRAVRIA